MKCQLLSGKKPHDKLEPEIKKELDSLPIKPCLLSISIGIDSSKEVYVKNKMKLAESLGFGFEFKMFDEHVSYKDILDYVQNAIDKREITGVIFERPTHKEELENLLDEIPPEYDIDGLGSTNLGSLVKGKPIMISATAQAVLHILDFYGINTEGQSVVVVGRSPNVGLSISLLLLSKSRNATVTVCHSKTKGLPFFTRNADILISSAGKPWLINADMVKDNAVVVDVGFNVVEQDGKRIFAGDVDFEGVKDKVRAITPVPGGVGQLTPLFLVKNLIKAARIISERER